MHIIAYGIYLFFRLCVYLLTSFEKLKTNINTTLKQKKSYFVSFALLCSVERRLPHSPQAIPSEKILEYD